MPPISAASRPNVLFIITDDHQFDALGAAGHPVVKTPALDALAARGVRFTQATNMGSLMPAICSPSRASLLTGANPLRADTNPRPGGASGDFVTIPPALPTLPEIFREAGYQTFIAGKWHNDRATLLRSFEQGRQIFLGGMCEHTEVPVSDIEAIARGEAPRVGPGFSTELFCQATVDFIQRRDRNRPFLGWLAVTSPHDPRTPPDSFRRAYPPASLPLPPGFAAEPAFDNGELDVRDERLAVKPLAPADIREHLADYYGMVTHQDHEIGRVLQALQESGAGENTLIVYIGDHGLALGRHGLLGKQNLYEHSVRVPLIIAGPGVAAGAQSDAMVYSLDIFSTLLELAGLPARPGLDSVSFVPQLQQPGRAGRPELFSLYKDCQRMVRDDRWKLIEYCVAGASRIELFDLMHDLAEEHDRAGDARCQETVRRLREHLVRWQERLGDHWMPVNLNEVPSPART